jgi:hypothetical protein
MTSTMSRQSASNRRWYPAPLPPAAAPPLPLSDSCGKHDEKLVYRCKIPTVCLGSSNTPSTPSRLGYQVKWMAGGDICVVEDRTGHPDSCQMDFTSCLDCIPSCRWCWSRQTTTPRCLSTMETGFGCRLGTVYRDDCAQYD